MSYDLILNSDLAIVGFLKVSSIVKSNQMLSFVLRDVLFYCFSTVDCSCLFFKHGYSENGIYATIMRFVECVILLPYPSLLEISSLIILLFFDP